MDVNTEITVAIIAGTVTVLGWIVANYYSKIAYDRTHRLEAILRHMERQIEEFYGPLFSLISQMQTMEDVLEEILEPGDGLQKSPLNHLERDQIISYFRQTCFFPIHEQIRDLLKTKLFLIDGAEVPDSFDKYLQHAVQERAQAEIWQNLHIDTSYLQGKEYSEQFFTDVESKLQSVMREYETTLSEMRPRVQRRTTSPQGLGDERQETPRA